MFWIVQSNLYQEQNYQQMMDALVRLGVEHQSVEVESFVGKEAKLIPEPVIPAGKAVFVCGSTKLMRMAIKRGWEPGSFMNANMRYEAWDAALGDELLNHGAKLAEFGSVELPEYGEWFIRPCEDGKAFTGRPFYREEFNKWRDHLNASNGVVVNNNFERIARGVPDNTPVAFSPVRKILREYRFFVVDRKIVTGSLYKMGGKLSTDSTVDEDVLAYAEKMVDRWQPSRAFVIDIAMIDGLNSDGLQTFDIHVLENCYKVVEYNCINCSGFYACDTAKIVNAIEEMGY